MVVKTSLRSSGEASTAFRAGLLTLFTSLLLAATLFSQRRQLLQLHISSANEDQPSSGSDAPPASGQLAYGASTPVHGGGPSGNAGPPSTTECSLSVQPSPFASSCTHLRDVCVDQGSVIAYRKEDGQRISKTEPGYELIEPGFDYQRFSFIRRSDGQGDPRYRCPPIRVRPAAADEGAAYLQQPLFSSCTVPIVWYPFERLTNFAHTFRDNAAKLLGGLEEVDWAPHAKLVLMTAEGLPAPGWNHDILQPLFGSRVETWAEFTSRLPAQQARNQTGYIPAAWADSQLTASERSQVAPSFEGPPQRCFRHMFVCNKGIEMKHWALHALGLRLAEHYQHQLQPAGKATAPAVKADQQRQQGQRPNEAAAVKRSSTSRDEERSGGIGTGHASSGSSGDKERVLRILFHRRSSPDRQLLNAAELIEQCNSWSYTSAAGQKLRASCAEVEPVSLLVGMQAAQEADVFVGVHGANMANGWLMRPGSSMIELQPFGFDAAPAHLQYPLFNERDQETGVLWWAVSVCDPAASTPGREERLGINKSEKGWARDRNLLIEWPVLQHVLETAVEVGGNMTVYRQRWQQGRWWWFAGSGGKMQVAGPGRVTQMRCPEELLGQAGNRKEVKTIAQ